MWVTLFRDQSGIWHFVFLVLCFMLGHMPSIESLHSHTTLSDGKLSHKEAFELAEKLKYEVIAFTDHDSLPDTATLEYLETLRGRKTKWIIGIEITSNPPQETAALVRGGIHIIGLFLDPANGALLEHCRKVQQARVKRAEKIIENLHALGLIVERELVFEKAKGDAIGLPHVVEVLLSHAENIPRIASFMEEFRRDAEKDPSLALRYQETLRRGESQYPYALFFNNPCYRNEVRVPISYKVDLDQSVALIRGAGGIASVAHYSMDNCRDMIPFPLLEMLLGDGRLDGMETLYGQELPEDHPWAAERATVRSIVERTGAIATGGADAHTEEDFRAFAEDKRFSGETIGMTAVILRKRPELSTRWSSLYSV